MKAISYSLFGYNKERQQNCFPFDGYLTGLMLSIRLNMLVYPDWVNVLHTDRSTRSGYGHFFDCLEQSQILKVDVNNDGAAICEAMLWRLKPVFDRNYDPTVQGYTDWKYTHVICRDLDSLSTYRDAQAVQVWINNDKAVHAITDSVSHDVEMLGGMIGFNTRHFSAITNIRSFEQLMSLCRIDLSRKGSDQTFLNSVIYPLVAEKGKDSITQHYYKGRGKTWLGDFHTCRCWEDCCRQGHKEGCPENITLDLPAEMRETNEVSEHLGASGWNQVQTMAIIEKHKDKFKDLLEIEKPLNHIFHWAK